MLMIDAHCHAGHGDSHGRFLSIRKGANGSTLADVRGKSILDGNGLFARSFRAVRRL
jgi:imidazolonepropionase-like amidohydrolase